jgi:hypothetical protein
MSRNPLVSALLCLVMLFSLAVFGAAEDAAADLTIQGRIGDGSAITLDLATVMDLPAHSFSCVDPWDGKEHRFTGVLLQEMLSRYGIESSSTRVTITAKNKYSIPIRRVDYERCGYILAWKIDGRLFGDDKATKNRGSFIISIDFAKHPELDPQLYKHQLVWQVNGILVE